MPLSSLPDNYSNDDKANEGFALPIVCGKRKADQAGLQKPNLPPSKRQNVGPVRNQMRDEFG